LIRLLRVAGALSDAVLDVTVKGVPSYAENVPLSCQPPMTFASTPPELKNRRPAPNGS
jgi:hypothetical protein